MSPLPTTNAADDRPLVIAVVGTQRHVSEAARVLGLSRSALYRRLAALRG